MISIQHQICVPKSSVELYIIDEQFPDKFKPLRTGNLWLTVTTTCDLPHKKHVIVRGEENSNIIHVNPFVFDFDIPHKDGVYAIVLTVNIEGQPCADEKQCRVLSVQPKWEFHVKFDEYEELLSQSGFMSLVWSNDNTSQVLFMKWQTSDKFETILDETVIAQIRKHQLNVNGMHTELRKFGSERKKNVMNSASIVARKLDLDDSNAEQEARRQNYYTVPCSVLGPIGQTRVFNPNILNSNFESVRNVMPEDDALLVDYEQAYEINAQNVKLRQPYWMTLVTHLCIKTLVEVWEAAGEKRELNVSNVRDALEAFKQTHGLDAGNQLHDVFFRNSTHYVSSHLDYVPDTNMTNCKEDKLNKVTGDSSGESQLMGGINTIASTYVRRDLNEGYESALSQDLVANIDVSGDVTPMDCEDGAWRIAALQSFLKNTSFDTITSLWQTQNDEIEEYKTLVLELIQFIQEHSTRECAACLGVASAANINDAQNSTLVQPQFDSVRRHNFWLKTNLDKTKIQGHCWCACVDVTKPNFLSGIEIPNNVEVGMLKSVLDGESTSLTYDVTTDPDPEQNVKIDSNNDGMQKQFQNVDGTQCRFSTAASIRNSVFAEFLKHSHGENVVCNGLQFANQKDLGGFLMFMFCVGGHNIFTFDETNLRMAVPTPQRHRFQNITIRQACNQTEQEYIQKLVACDIAKYPHINSCKILPPSLCKVYGKRGSIAVVCREYVNDIQSTDKDLFIKVLKQRQREFEQNSKRMDQVQCVGFEMIDLQRVIFFFEPIQ